MDSGKERLENTLAKSDLVLPETSHQGQDLIQEELNMLTTEYDGFSQDCEDLQDTLGKTNHTIVLNSKSQYPMLHQGSKTSNASVVRHENESHLFTEKLLAEWLRYEDEYGELIQWMKTTENSMKAESELKASLEEKTIQYEKQNVSFFLNLRNIFLQPDKLLFMNTSIHVHVLCKGYKLKLSNV